MTPNEINEAIARSLGWKQIDGLYTEYDTQERRSFTTSWKNAQGHFKPLPNYYSSLDACAEFESSLSRDANTNNRTEAGDYIDKIGDVLCLGNGCLVLAFDIATATAPQRCESYLKLKGMWK